MNALHLWRTSWSAHPSQGRNHRDGVAEHEVLLVVWLAFFGLLVFASWLLWQPSPVCSPARPSRAI